MGARSKARRHARAHHRQSGRNNTSHSQDRDDAGAAAATAALTAAADGGDMAAGRPTTTGPVPHYIQRLLHSTQFAELEEVCADISVFALQSGQHEQLIRAGVPQRLTQLIFDPSSPTRAAAGSAQENDNDDEEEKEKTAATTSAIPLPGEPCDDAHPRGHDLISKSHHSANRVHRGMLYMQIAAVEALRNVISASGNDAVLDVLTAESMPGGSGATGCESLSFGAGLCHAIAQTWQRVIDSTHARAEQRQRQESEEQTEDGDNDAHHRDEAAICEGAHNDSDCDTVAHTNNNNNEEEEEKKAESDKKVRRCTAEDDAPRLTMSLLRHLASLLQLLSVCIEGSEAVAEVCSQAPHVQTCMRVLHHAHTVLVNTGLAHTSIRNNNNNNNKNKTHEEEAQHVHRAEEMCESAHSDDYDVAERWAEVGVAASDAIATLSSDNATLMQLMAGPLCAHADATPRNTREEQGGMLPCAEGTSTLLAAMLNHLVDADAVLPWLSALPSHLATHTNHACTGQEQEALDALRSDALRLQQLQITLHAQLTLMQLCPSADEVRRVVPTVTHTLRVWTPMAQWCEALPLLREDCAREELCRAAAVRRVTHRVRCVHLAARLLQRLVDVVGEHNASGEDDEVAFRANPWSRLLYEQGTLEMFAPVLRDVLWMRRGVRQATTAAASHGACHTCVNDAATDSSVTASAHTGMASHHNNSSSTNHTCTDQQEEDVMWRAQRALRCGGVGAINAEVTTLQFLLLSTEVVVWGIASALLLMVPVEQLGDARAIWSAVMTALRTRYDLLREQQQQQQQQQEMQTRARAAVVGSGVYNIATDSPAARSLLWLQLESLAQMLWTMQRKQAKSAGGALCVCNTLGAGPADVDVLTRLAWESAAIHTSNSSSGASAAAATRHGGAVDVSALRQACVGAVGLLCCSLRHVDAVSAGARFTLAVLRARMPVTQARECNKTEAKHGVTPGGVHGGDTLFLCGDDILNRGSASCPTAPAAREAWLARLKAVDGVMATRCEAANALMDFFLDETYDATVYGPLGVQRALEGFVLQLRTALRRRQQLTKEMHKNYRLDVEPAAMEQWIEVADNLGEFLSYKRQHMASV